MDIPILETNPPLIGRAYRARPFSCALGKIFAQWSRYLGAMPIKCRNGATPPSGFERRGLLSAAGERSVLDI